MTHTIQLCMPAVLVGEGDREVAWAERSLRVHPEIRWVLGRFVEAERANAKQQFWALDELRAAAPTIEDMPINILHQARRVVGHVVDAEVVYPVEQASDDRPRLEILGALYRNVFPEDMAHIERAHQEGQLFFSHECVPTSMVCSGEQGCGREFPYHGPQHPTYCEELNEQRSVRAYRGARFIGAGLVLPPVAPGWREAHVTELAADPVEHTEQGSFEMSAAERRRRALEIARTFTVVERRRYAQRGFALPDGSFPILNEQDLKNAIQAIGRAKDRERARRHIVRRARALGLTKLLPETWT